MDFNRNKSSILTFLAVISLAAGLSLLPLSCRRGPFSYGERSQQRDTVYPLGFLTDTLYRVPGKVKSGENFSSWLVRLGLSGRKAYEMSLVCDTVFNVRRLVGGNRFDAYYWQRDSSEQALHYIVYHNSVTTSTIFRCFDSLAVWKYEKPVISEERFTDVTINSSLWNDMISAGAPPHLIIKLSDIYAWTVDFFGLQNGDRFRVLYDQKICDGEVIAVDTVRFAEFIRRNDTLPAIMFNPGDGGNIYWNEKGESMRKAFLKAPLHFTRVSSGFSYARRHPVTHRVQPHTGVDYAAPTGTPVMSIGDGTVVSAGNTGAGGNTVKIRHNSVYTTAYLHLSKYGPGIRSGVRVRQGQIIGYVGATGRCTGPHLDFRVWRNGSPINPLTMQSPPQKPLPSELLPAFDSVRTVMCSKVDSLAVLYENQ
ncbi:MAG: peptidoglycan DD-metalloendopeptidase family protein [Bacteroidales bacterium]|nr:peptidoglycan DD-metalloendopeptidase family protein [Bacteroidales bacterium]